MRNVTLGCALLGLFPNIVRAQGTIAADKGKFSLRIQENEIATETFTSDTQGGSECDLTLTLPQIKGKSRVSVKAVSDQPTQIVVEADPGGKYKFFINGTKGHLDSSGGGKTVSKDVTLPAKVYLYGNFTPHLLAPLLRGYDVRAGGPQKVTLIAVDSGSVTPATLTAQPGKPMTVGGKALPISRYVLSLPGAIGNVDLLITADSQGRVLMWNVPGQGFIAIREGFEDLLKPETPADPTLSKPTYAVKKETVKIALRDGVKTAADVYRPDAPGKFPVILQRTPYDRSNANEASFWARRGYVFVAQDVRGKFESEGEWHPFVNEARDGHDSVEWCAAQPWSSGSVGMIGGSYLGFVQWAAAREGSPHLKCLIPIVSPPDPFFNIPYAYGAFFLYGNAWWAAITDGKGMAAPKPVTNLDGFRKLPLTEVDKALFGHHIAFFQEWLQHDTNDAYYQQVAFNDKMKTMGEIPALHVSGWFDGDGIGTKRNYAAMVESGHKNQKLIYGAWSHAVNTSTRLGTRDFGPQSLRDLETLYLRWFDHWLKGVENGVEKEPPVEAFLMGENRWRQFSAWPPQEAVMTKWYLHSNGHANSDQSDGTLSTTVPAADEPADLYAYDPAHPLSVFGTLDPSDENNAAGAISAHLKDPSALVYTSEALTDDLVVAGPILLHLTAASSAKDTDWFATLEEVDEKGNAFSLVQGIIRARFRHSFEKPEMLTPGKAEEYTIDLWAVGNVFRKGHRVRLVVASSCFPIYDRNLNTGEDIATGVKMVTAQQTVQHDAMHLSYVELPTLLK